MDAIIICIITLYFYLKSEYVMQEIEIPEVKEGREVLLNPNFIRNDKAFTEVYDKIVNTYINT